MPSFYILGSAVRTFRTALLPFLPVPEISGTVFDLKTSGSWVP